MRYKKEDEESGILGAIRKTYYRGIKYVTLIFVIFYRYAELQLLNFSAPRKVFYDFKSSLDF